MIKNPSIVRFLVQKVKSCDVDSHVVYNARNHTTLLLNFFERRLKKLTGLRQHHFERYLSCSNSLHLIFIRYWTLHDKSLDNIVNNSLDMVYIYFFYLHMYTIVYFRRSRLGLISSLWTNIIYMILILLFFIRVTKLLRYGVFQRMRLFQGVSVWIFMRMFL